MKRFAFRYGDGSVDAWLDVWAEAWLTACRPMYGGGCPRWVSITDTTEYTDRLMPTGEPVSASGLWEQYSDRLEVGAESESCCAVFVSKAADAPSFEDTVGCYAVDDRTFIYVTEAPVTMDELFEAFSSSWLVCAPAYEEADERGYCTNVSNSPSCGPYRLSSLVPGERIVLTRNPYWYGWDTNEDGSPVAFTRELVNGEHLEIYKTTRIVISKMDHDQALAAFEAGRSVVSG